MLARKRREFASEIQGMKLHHETFGGFANGDVASPEQVAEMERRQADEALRQQRSDRNARWVSLMERRGSRYKRCNLNNYETDTREQEIALEEVRDYASKLPDRLNDGGGLVLWGPPGTGKDHLVSGVALIAIRDFGWSIGWENGADLRGEIRDRMDSKEAEAALIKRLTWPTALWISDPLPPFGNLGDHQADMLCRIVDARYSRDLPTWITMNVADSAEAVRRMGPQTVDRLKHGARTVLCNWPSYRSPS